VRLVTGVFTKWWEARAEGYAQLESRNKIIGNTGSFVADVQQNYKYNIWPTLWIHMPIYHSWRKVFNKAIWASQKWMSVALSGLSNAEALHCSSMVVLLSIDSVCLMCDLENFTKIQSHNYADIVNIKWFPFIE